MERIARIVNFRVFLITAITAIFSILAVILLPAIASIITITAFGIALAIFLAFAIKSKNAVKIITTILCFLTATACIISTSISINTWKNEIDLDKEYEITAKIQSINKTDFGAGYILTDFNANNASKNGNIYLTVHNSDGITINFLKVGDTIKFKSTLYFYELVDKTPDGYRYRNAIRYGAQVDENTIEFINANPSFLDNIRNSIYTALVGALGENGAIAYGMITGEKGFMSDDATDVYSASGLGHILAVSGLHIGFFVLMMSFLLDKLKANRVVKLLVILPLLLAYCFMASFSPSVIRATIMCIVGLIADMFAQRRDTLNSLSLAVTVMLLIKPLYLFDVGFIMSVTAVFGIILFARSLGIAFNKFLPKFIAKPLAVSLSAQIGITPISIITFNTFSLYSVLTNLFMIPLVTIAFIAIVIALIFVLIFPACSVLLTVAGLPLALVDTIANLIAYLPFSQITIFASSFFVISYALLFVASEYFALPKFKWIATIVSVVAIIGFLIPCNIPLSRDYDIIAVSAYKSVTTIVRSPSGVTVVGDCNDYYSIDDTLTSAKESRIDAVLVNSVDEKTASALVKLSKKYGKFSVYCSEKSNYDDFHILIQNDVPFYLTNYTYNAIYGIKSVYNGDTFIGYGYSSSSASILMLGYGTKINQIPASIINEYGLIRSYVFSGDYIDRIYIVNYENAYESNLPTACIVTKNNPVAVMLKTGESLYLIN